MNRFTNPCVIVDILAGVWFDEVTEMLVEVIVLGVRADVVVERWIGVSVDVVIYGAVSGIGVEVLSDVNVNPLISAMTAFDFAIPEPSKELMPFC